MRRLSSPLRIEERELSGGRTQLTRVDFAPPARDHPREVRLFLTAAVCSFLFFPSSIGARIVPNACIGGIGLYDTSTRVLAEWGKPLRRTRTGPEVRWHYKNGSVVLTFDHAAATTSRAVVVAIATTDPSQRTSAGIGPGSTLRQVKAVYPWCSTTGCDISGRDDRSTDLTIKRRRVSEVSVSLYTDYDHVRLPVDPRCRSS